MSEGKRMDQFVRIDPSKPFDLGWAIATMDEDDNVTRTCKGCGVSVTTKYDRITGKVAVAPVVHQRWCPILLGNNSALS